MQITSPAPPPLQKPNVQVHCLCDPKTLAIHKITMSQDIDLEAFISTADLC